MLNCQIHLCADDTLFTVLLILLLKRNYNSLLINCKILITQKCIYTVFLVFCLLKALNHRGNNSPHSDDSQVTTCLSGTHTRTYINRRAGRSNSGFIILPEDNLTCRPVEPATTNSLINRRPALPLAQLMQKQLCFYFT